MWLDKEAGEVSYQQADKHGPAIDEEMKRPRRQVAAGNRHGDRPENDPLSPAAADGVRLRSELARFLGPAAFPGSADDLLAAARENDATDEVDRLLQQTPEGTYRTVEEVFEAIRGPMDV